MRALVLFATWSFFASCVIALGLCVKFVYLEDKHHSQKADCTVSSCTVNLKTCYRTVCTTGSTTNSKNCHSVPYTCYSVEIVFFLNQSNSLIWGSDSYSFDYYSSAVSKCNSNSQGSQVTCWYDDRHKIPEITLKRSKTMAGGIASVVIFTLASLASFVFGVILLL